MKITIFGTGYVGLVQAAVFADAGYEVICVDIDEARVARLKAGEVPIFEPGLGTLLKDNAEAERLTFTTDAPAAIRAGEVIFIAVGTPSDEDGSADLQYVLAVAATIAEHMEEPRIVVTKSTVPVGTSAKVRAEIARVLKARGREDLDYDVASNPEFLKEGSAVADCTKPDRIIIGVDRADSGQRLRELYAPFNRNHDKIILMDVYSAEMTKYAANCILATKISFMNEMASLADILGADIEKVRLGIGSDPRIGYQFIYPGIGYGGSCFPKDVKAMIHTAESVGFDAEVLRSVEDRNAKQKRMLFDKITRYFDGELAGRTFGLWGLAFKPNTDDMRESPARVLMELLWEAGAKVRAHDPEAMEECRRIYGERDDLVLCEQRDDVLTGADALILATEWKNFRVPDFKHIKATLTHPVIFDGRNIYDPAVAARYGLNLFGVGRDSASRAVRESIGS
ncbi:UDP-glucose dehydrogenase family protein [Pararhizobium mangrovi]|uniref:UDP-glucose 6-dehydrogenase n=1 Tax=Pararhizobium mangrovi TaxID=2590452 RepID=A0A506U4U1_9HYPH|nr:UDP-glucose/GDP-mannose dehydrogenase family protein [Pararhizobium mangrovi]TPW27569.1 UDP-glucose/GDP-mannose dehydrogenase family protein [Pararhizobium mangrovi]